MLKLLAECSLKSNIVFPSKLEDGLFLGLSNGVKNFSNFSSLIAPFQMISSLVYCNYSFQDLFSFLFSTSGALVDPCNVTHLSIKFIMFNDYSRKKKMQPKLNLHLLNQYQHPFVGTCILVFWFRLWTLDPIMFPTNQPIKGDYFALNLFFSFKVHWTITHMF
jgi:hypothetical protein